MFFYKIENCVSGLYCLFIFGKPIEATFGQYAFACIKLNNKTNKHSLSTICLKSCLQIANTYIPNTVLVQPK